jgi:hypothetical protein
MTRDLSRGRVLEFNPYAIRTGPLRVSYSLTKSYRQFLHSGQHPAATCDAPAHQHNMLPVKALVLSSGRGIHEFSDLWQKGIHASMHG